MDRGKGYRWIETLRLLRVRPSDGVEMRWVTRVSLHCISQHSQGVLGVADLAVHSLHSISVKKGSKKFFQVLAVVRLTQSG